MDQRVGSHANYDNGEVATAVPFLHHRGGRVPPRYFSIRIQRLNLLPFKPLMTILDS